MCDSQLVSSSHFLIRSEDRDNRWSTTPSDFSINLSKPLKGSKCQISFAQIPNTYYNITSFNNSIVADVGAEATTEYLIPSGCYTLNDFISALQNLLSPLGAPVVSFDPIKNKITISNNVNFTIDLSGNNNMSALLGFAPNVYSNALSFTGQYVPKLFDNSIYISVSFASHIQTTTQYLHNVSFVIPHNCNRGEIIQFYSSTQFSLQPKVKDQTIGNIIIRVFDERGHILEQLGEWSIMLAIH